MSIIFWRLEVVTQLHVPPGGKGRFGSRFPGDLARPARQLAFL